MGDGVAVADALALATCLDDGQLVALGDPAELVPLFRRWLQGDAMPNVAPPRLMPREVRLQRDRAQH